jgi:Tfp pilus assembly protein PilX
MSRETAALILVILTLLAVVGLNYLLIQSVRSTARRSDHGTLRKLLKTAPNPFREADRDLDTLAELVETLSTQKEPAADTTLHRSNIDKEDQV